MICRYIHLCVQRSLSLRRRDASWDRKWEEARSQQEAGGRSRPWARCLLLTLVTSFITAVLQAGQAEQLVLGEQGEVGARAGGGAGGAAQDTAAQEEAHGGQQQQQQQQQQHQHNSRLGLRVDAPQIALACHYFRYLRYLQCPHCSSRGGSVSARPSPLTLPSPDQGAGHQNNLRQGENASWNSPVTFLPPSLFLHLFSFNYRSSGILFTLHLSCHS